MALNPQEKQRRLEQRRIEKWNREHRIINGIDFKQCNICNEWKVANLVNFYKGNNKIDGLQAHCSDCEKAKNALWRKNNPLKRKISIKKDNANPRKQKLMRELNEKRRKEGKFKEWQQNNKDKLSGYNLNRKLNKKHQISKQEWDDCKKFFEYKCDYCELSESDHKLIHKQQLHKEHLIHEGRNDIKNCVPACKNCNSEKHTSSLNNWYNISNINYTTERYIKIYTWIRFEAKKIAIKKVERKCNKSKTN